METEADAKKKGSKSSIEDIYFVVVGRNFSRNFHMPFSFWVGRLIIWVSVQERVATYASDSRIPTFATRLYRRRVIHPLEKALPP
jgi:hypothetical protein